MQRTLLVKQLFTALVVAALTCVLSSCVKATSTDEDILNDAGTASNAAIILDPDEAASSKLS